MLKTTEELMFGAESQARVAKAVQDAVARADAAGLPPAFQPYTTLAKVLPRAVILAIRRQELANRAAVRQAAERAQILELRRQARAEKAGRDLEDLEFHRAVVELLYAGGQVNKDIKRQALEAVQLWEDRQTCSPRYSFTWREWLDMPPEFGRRAILDETDLGLSMRCNTPFGFMKGLKNKSQER